MEGSQNLEGRTQYNTRYSRMAASSAATGTAPSDTFGNAWNWSIREMLMTVAGGV